MSALSILVAIGVVGFLMGSPRLSGFIHWLTSRSARAEKEELRLAAASARGELLHRRKRVESEEARVKRDEARRKEAWWRSLSGHEFEKELFELFELRGYDVRLTGFHGGDGGVDLTISSGAKRIIVQCKARRQFISAGAVRELYGTLLHEQQQGRATEAWLVSCSGFYSGAELFAAGKPIQLLTIRQILAKHEARFL